MWRIFSGTKWLNYLNKIITTFAVRKVNINNNKNAAKNNFHHFFFTDCICNPK